MTRSRALLLALRVIVSLVLLGLVVSRVDVPRSLQLLGGANAGWVLAGFFFAVLGVVISSAQWAALLEPEGIRPGLPMLTRLYFLGYSFNVLLPTTVGGDVVKAVWLSRLSGRAVGSIGSTLMARVVGFSVLLLTSLPVSLAASLLWRAFGWIPTIFLLLVSAAFLGLLAILLFGHRLIDRLPFAKGRVGEKLLEFARNLGSYPARRGALLAALALSFCFYCSLNLNYFFYGVALHLQAPFWFYWAAIPILSIVTVVPFSLNGYGLREGTLIVLFKLVGDRPERSLSLALMVELQLLLFALVGLVVLLSLRGQNRVTE